MPAVFVAAGTEDALLKLLTLRIFAQWQLELFHVEREELGLYRRLRWSRVGSTEYAGLFESSPEPDHERWLVRIGLQGRSCRVVRFIHLDRRVAAPAHQAANPAGENR